MLSSAIVRMCESHTMAHAALGHQLAIFSQFINLNVKLQNVQIHISVIKDKMFEYQFNSIYHVTGDISDDLGMLQITNYLQQNVTVTERKSM